MNGQIGGANPQLSYFTRSFDECLNDKCYGVQMLTTCDDGTCYQQTCRPDNDCTLKQLKKDDVLKDLRLSAIKDAQERNLINLSQTIGGQPKLTAIDIMKGEAVDPDAMTILTDLIKKQPPVISVNEQQAIVKPTEEVKEVKKEGFSNYFNHYMRGGGLEIKPGTYFNNLAGVVDNNKTIWTGKCCKADPVGKLRCCTAEEILNKSSDKKFTNEQASDAAMQCTQKNMCKNVESVKELPMPVSVPGVQPKITTVGKNSVIKSDKAFLNPNFKNCCEVFDPTSPTGLRICNDAEFATCTDCTDPETIRMHSKLYEASTKGRGIVDCDAMAQAIKKATEKLTPQKGGADGELCDCTKPIWLVIGCSCCVFIICAILIFIVASLTRKVKENYQQS